MRRILSTVILSLWASIAFALQMTPPSGGDSFTNPRTGDSYTSTGSAISIDQADVSYAFSRGWVTASQPTVGSSPVTTIVLPANVVGDCAKWITPTQAGDSGGACGGGAGAITLQTDGTNNASQTTLNLVPLTGISITNPSGGTVDFGISEPVNAQTGTTYTVLSTDCGKQITFNNAAAIAVSLPQATGSFASCQIDFTDIGAGTATITPTTSTINGAATLAVAQNRQCTVNSDGTNWQVAGCTALVSGGGAGMIGFNSGSGTPAATQYIPFFGSVNWLTSSENNVEFSAPRAGTVSNLYVHAAANIAAATTLQFTLRDNAVSETVTCTIAASTNTCNDTTHTFSFAQGDLLDWQTVQTGTGSATIYDVSFVVQ